MGTQPQEATRDRTPPQSTVSTTKSFIKDLFNNVKSVLPMFKEPGKEDVQTILHTQQNYLYLDIIRGCVFWHNREVNMVQSQVQSQLNSHKEIMSKQLWQIRIISKT